MVHLPMSSLPGLSNLPEHVKHCGMYLKENLRETAEWKNKLQPVTQITLPVSMLLHFCFAVVTTLSCIFAVLAVAGLLLLLQVVLAHHDE